MGITAQDLRRPSQGHDDPTATTVRHTNIKMKRFQCKYDEQFGSPREKPVLVRFRAKPAHLMLILKEDCCCYLIPPFNNEHERDESI